MPKVVKRTLIAALLGWLLLVIPYVAYGPSWGRDAASAVNAWSRSINERHRTGP